MLVAPAGCICQISSLVCLALSVSVMVSVCLGMPGIIVRVRVCKELESG